jgi:PHS family inorganic phosphate transporter-like MFS transporter
MLPAEVFPTRYRGTCYGIAAAAGKLGSIVVQLVVPATDISEPESPATRFAYLLIAFAVLMPLGALFAWAWIPDVQEDRGRGFPKDNEAQRGTGQHQASVSRWVLPSKSLEVLGEGKQGLERDGVQLIGLRKNVERAFGRMTRGILR